jgi:hypothetical protein
MTFDSNEFLNWIIYGGGSIAIFSFVAVYWKKFQLWSKEKKFWVSSGISSVLAVASYFAVQYVPAEVFAQINPIAQIIGVVLLANGFKQIWYDNVTGSIKPTE